MERHLGGEREKGVLIEAVYKEVTEAVERYALKGSKELVNPLQLRRLLRMGMQCWLFIDIFFGEQVAVLLPHTQNGFGHYVIAIVPLFLDQSLQFVLHLGYRVDSIDGIHLAVRRIRHVNLVLTKRFQSNRSVAGEPLLHCPNRRSREMIPIRRYKLARSRQTLSLLSVRQNDIQKNGSHRSFIPLLAVFELANLQVNNCSIPCEIKKNSRERVRLLQQRG